MTWVLAGVAVWLVLAVLVGILVGHSIRIADRKATENAAPEANFVVDPAQAPRSATPVSSARPVSRPRVPASEQWRFPRHDDPA
jgi:hypothetical protein